MIMHTLAEAIEQTLIDLKKDKKSKRQLKKNERNQFGIRDRWKKK